MAHPTPLGPGPAPLGPGDVIGILGGGQLGRMLAFAAHRLGFQVHGFSPEPDSPLAQVTNRFTLADYGDREALARFAEDIDVATFEFENVPVDAVEFLIGLVPVHPGAGPLGIIQDRLSEKRFLADAGIAVPAFASVSRPEDLAVAVLKTGLPAIMKTRRFGYDGKGQAPVASGAEAEAAWAALGRVDCILESRIDFDCEVSVVAARDRNGAMAAYPLAENRHVHHILDTSIAPAPVPDSVGRAAIDMARTILEDLGYVGVLAVEMFLKDDALMVNELAPRVHNSGHWTIEGAATSQFEQHIRAVSGLPLGPTEALFHAEMTNLVGDAVLDWRSWLDDPSAHLHLYGKNAVRPGRKMGHATRIRPLSRRR